ncbi:uncharacterized protein LOC133822635 isoform X3 [Humulus lupulus]|uniref:uncharacterized protein LOC133822635 isoform X3 n=1 Tax=Humulus lupulus TaxID=3486 RepID=UPI002B4126D6|nr:uncharacterized protein LOC133822635 isoform X3 [Humulus lupulus]
MSAAKVGIASPIITTSAFSFAKHTYSQPNRIWLQFSGSPKHKSRLRLVECARASLSRTGQGAFDPELRLVLDLATDSELYELENILFGPSYFSPLLKSITKRTDVDYAMIEEDLQEREHFIEALESRFLFLAADARSTLSEELEAFPGLLEFSRTSNAEGGLELGLSRWKVQALSALKDVRSVVLKGGGIVTLAKILQLLSKRLSGKVFAEAANYQIKREVIKKGGQLAAINLESRAAMLAAKQGLVGAASRYIGLRSMMTLLGPMLWGTFLADVVIQMLGTDYARILRAIYAFAQIRITRTYNFSSGSDENNEHF